MIDKEYAYNGDHELIHDEGLAEEVHAAFAAIIGAESWPERWAGMEVRRLLADREEVQCIRASAEINGWSEVLETCPPVPEIPLWLLYGDE
jgi:hypothetical protein